MSEFIYQPGVLGTPERDDAQVAEEEAWRKSVEEANARREAERQATAVFHSVKVATCLDDEGTEDERRVVDTVTFTCTAPPDADCRTYPECDCEVFDWNDDETADVEGHPRVSGRPCWLTGWFDMDGAVYSGDDYDDMRDDCVPAIDREGSVVFTFIACEEYLEWEFLAPVGMTEGTDQ